MFGMNCFTNAIQMGAVGMHLKQIESRSYAFFSSERTGRGTIGITMRDRSKNRKPLQKGRYLSTEAIQTVQALKRAANQSDISLEQAFDNRFRRLLKFDMVAVLKELLRQNQCVLALKAFRDVKKEDWYKPQILLYAEMITVLGSNGFHEKVELIVRELKADRIVDADVEAFNALLESLLNLNLTGLAMECYYLMKSLPCDPDRKTFEILMDGLKSSGEMNLIAVIQEDAGKYYGDFANFSDEPDCKNVDHLQSTEGG